MKRKIAVLAALAGGLMLSGCVDDGYGYGSGGYGIYSSSAYPGYYNGYNNGYYGGGYYGGGYYRGQPGYRALPRGAYDRRDYRRRDNDGVRDRGRWEGRGDRATGNWSGQGSASGWQQRNNNWSRNPAGTGQPRGNWGGRRR